MNNDMNRLAARFSIALAGACLAAVVATPAMAQDKGKAAAATPAKASDQRGRKVLVDNEKVLATEVTYKPGSASGMIERGNRVTRALTDGQLEKTYPDGKKETLKFKAGDVRYNPKETYSQKNTGTTDVVLFSMTIK